MLSNNCSAGNILIVMFFGTHVGTDRADPTQDIIVHLQGIAGSRGHGVQGAIGRSLGRTDHLSPIAAAARAVAATVEEIAGAIAAGGWVVLVILAVIIIIFVIIMALVGYWEDIPTVS